MNYKLLRTIPLLSGDLKYNYDLKDDKLFLSRLDDMDKYFIETPLDIALEKFFSSGISYDSKYNLAGTKRVFDGKLNTFIPLYIDSDFENLKVIIDIKTPRNKIINSIGFDIPEIYQEFFKNNKDRDCFKTSFKDKFLIRGYDINLHTKKYYEEDDIIQLLKSTERPLIDSNFLMTSLYKKYNLLHPNFFNFCVYYDLNDYLDNTLIDIEELYISVKVLDDKNILPTYDILVNHKDIKKIDLQKEENDRLIYEYLNDYNESTHINHWRVRDKDTFFNVYPGIGVIDSSLDFEDTHYTPDYSKQVKEGELSTDIFTRSYWNIEKLDVINDIPWVKLGDNNYIKMLVGNPNSSFDNNYFFDANFAIGPLENLDITRMFGCWDMISLNVHNSWSKEPLEKLLEHIIDPTTKTQSTIYTRYKNNLVFEPNLSRDGVALYYSDRIRIMHFNSGVTFSRTPTKEEAAEYTPAQVFVFDGYDSNKIVYNAGSLHIGTGANYQNNLIFIPSIMMTIPQFTNHPNSKDTIFLKYDMELDDDLNSTHYYTFFCRNPLLYQELKERILEFVKYRDDLKDKFEYYNKDLNTIVKNYYIPDFVNLPDSILDKLYELITYIPKVEADTYDILRFHKTVDRHTYEMRDDINNYVVRETGWIEPYFIDKDNIYQNLEEEKSEDPEYLLGDDSRVFSFPNTIKHTYEVKSIEELPLKISQSFRDISFDYLNKIYKIDYNNIKDSTFEVEFILK